MWINTHVTFDWDGNVTSRTGYEYFGPVTWLKKGSDAAKNAANGAGQVGSTAQTLSTTDQAKQNSAQAKANPFATSLLPAKNGGLSPYAQAQYGQEKTQDAQNASAERGMGLRALSLRGFNNSPGSTASIMNTTNREQGAADTHAYETAMSNTLGEGLAGLNYFGNQQQIYDPNKPLQTATSAYGTQANAAQVMNSSPTLAGDIMSGLGGLAGAAGSVMTGMGGMGARF